MAPTTSTSPLDEAALQMATAENAVVFHGFAGVARGIAEARRQAGSTWGDVTTYPHELARAVERLLSSGISGPFGLALGSEPYRRVIESTEKVSATPPLAHWARSLKARWSGRPGSTAGYS